MAPSVLRRRAASSTARWRIAPGSILASTAGAADGFEALLDDFRDDGVVAFGLVAFVEPVVAFVAALGFVFVALTVATAALDLPSAFFETPPRFARAGSAT